MDHLILNEDAFEYPEVPYLDTTSTYVYDNADHPEFPRRMGWSWQEIQAIGQKRPPTVEGHTVEAAAALVQAWLYFGLIHVLTRLPVDTGQYVYRNADGRLFVTSKPLLSHLRRWQGMLDSQEDQGLNRIAQTDKLWKIFHYFLSYVAVIWSDLLPHSVGASIVVLHHTLALAKLSMYPNSYAPPSLCNFHDGFHKQIRAPLIDHGWCRMVVHRLGQRLSPLTLYHMASIKRSLPSKSGSHAACSSHRCQISKPSTGAFKLQHAVPDCRCQPIPSIQDQVTSIVEKGCIPVLSFSDDKDLLIESFSIASHRENDDYVAISHVWADGLGNATDNTMYRCQLRLLQDRVSKVLKSHSRHQEQAMDSNRCFFWIDTLCVPVQEGEVKSIAIGMMEHIYREACIVLVIDAGLKSLESAITSPFHLAISIVSSKWWTRLWTLQEGVFAQALYFQLSDDAVSPTDMLQRSRELFSNSSNSPAWDVQSMLVQDALSEVQNLSLSRLRKDSGRHILQHVSWRFTSREADEVICLAILLKLNVSKLNQLKQDPKVRMKAFILMQRFLPSSVLFGRGNFENRLEEEGFRWAPISFLGQTAGPSSYDNLFSDRWIDESPRVDTTHADEQGLHLRSHGFRLDFRNCMGTARQTLTNTAFDDQMTCLILEGPQQGVYSLGLMGRTSLSWEAILSWRIPLFVILPDLLEAGNRGLGGVLVSGSGSTGAAGTEIVCRYESRISVYIQERHLTGEPYTECPFGADVPGAVQATALAIEQQWCVR